MPSGIYKRKPHTEKTKQKIRNSLIGKVFSSERKKNISLALVGRKPSFGMLGKKASLETRKKMSNSQKKIGSKPPSPVGNKNNLGKKLSIETRKKMSVSHLKRKNKHHNWKDGNRRSNNKKIRMSIEYKLWREACFKRDNFICQKYGISGGILNAHHINNFSEFPEIRTSIENGITLSKKAHKEFHKKYGNKNNTKEQLLEFLNN